MATPTTTPLELSAHGWGWPARWSFRLRRAGCMAHPKGVDPQGLPTGIYSRVYGHPPVPKGIYPQAG